ncbi:MAG: agmatine deiminase family protein [Nitrososphaerota archaeon]|nr:agmatine deiminase family protein [Nitrososphaerota archaeon]MDG6919351.1 agmatine deiminase family protein [Nitrososphaerota archaeon]MDG6946879.1 agmatine deiminase family protein [Nitrososphaerota archaeon]
MTTVGGTPRSLGYVMPAEWERHEATWVSWPKNHGTFPGGILPKVEEAYVKMVGALAVGEEVRILVDDSKSEERVWGLVRGAERVTFHRIRTVDVWTRDYLPTYVRGSDVAVVKWRFNAWGGKYEDLLPDDESGEAVAAASRLRTFKPGVVLEGGSIDPNGAGTVLTTEQCLLNPNRNPRLRRDGIEKLLADYVGGESVVWLKRGIEGDDTDGHVDDIARFVAPRTVAAAVEPGRSDRNHAALDENLKILRAAQDPRGRPFQIEEIPMPAPVASADGRLPASHLNFYIGNAVVLVPTFGGESDRAAMGAMQALFPSREVVGVDCRALVHGLGTLHCVTQQVPSAHL